MTKILPIFKTPIVTYPNINASLGIALTHEETHDWFYNKFIQIYATIDKSQSVKGNFIDSNARTASCPFVHENEFEREYITSTFKSFTEFVKHCINTEQYVYTFLDRYYIKPSENYGKDHFAHQVFIIGYNDKKQTFYAGDFFYNEYRFCEISYRNVEDSYQNYEKVKTETDSVFPSICVFRYKKNISWNFSFELLLISLEDYLNERDSSNAFFYIMPLHLQKTFRYGLGYYKVLMDYLTKEMYDMRSYHILYEHKKMMNLRIKYLADKFGYINEEVKNVYSDLEKIALQNRNLILKDALKPVDKIHEKLFASLRKMEIEERKVLPSFISDLKSFK